MSLAARWTRLRRGYLRLTALTDWPDPVAFLYAFITVDAIEETPFDSVHDDASSHRPQRRCGPLSVVGGGDAADVSALAQGSLAPGSSDRTFLRAN